MTESLINSRSAAAWGVLLRSMGVGLICGLILFFAVFETVTLTGGAKAQSEKSSAMQAFAPALDHALPAIATVIANRGEDPEGNIFNVSNVRTALRGLNAISGAGVAIGPAGPMITSRRLVEGATAITACYRHGESCYNAHILGTDPYTDLALLSVDGGDLPFLTLGDSSHIEIGDLIMAIGSPYEGSARAALGTISAVSINEHGEYSGFLQTLNGTELFSQGGVLINLNGELIGFPASGVNVRERGRHPLAISSNLARQVVDRILSGLRSNKARIGNPAI